MIFVDRGHVPEVTAACIVRAIKAMSRNYKDAKRRAHLVWACEDGTYAITYQGRPEYDLLLRNPTHTVGVYFLDEAPVMIRRIAEDLRT